MREKDSLVACTSPSLAFGHRTKSYLALFDLWHLLPASTDHCVDCRADSTYCALARFAFAARGLHPRLPLDCLRPRFADVALVFPQDVRAVHG